jgi:hypothetical protein
MVYPNIVRDAGAGALSPSIPDMMVEPYPLRVDACFSAAVAFSRTLGSVSTGKGATGGGGGGAFGALNDIGSFLDGALILTDDLTVLPCNWR